MTILNSRVNILQII